MKKVVLFTLAIVLLLSLTLVGCNPKDAATEVKEDNNNAAGEATKASKEPVEIRVMGLANETRLAVYNKVFDKFNAEHDDVKVVFDHVAGAWEDFSQKFTTQLAGQNPPDIIDLSLIYRDTYINEGYILDVMPYAKESGFDFDKYYEGQFSGVRVNDGLYGVPSGSTLMAVYYNKDLFEKAGLELPPQNWEDGWTWEKFTEVAQQLTVGEGVEKQYGFATTFSIGWWFPTFYQNGADFVNKEGTECVINTPEGLETLEYINTLAHTAAPSLSSLETINAPTLFKTGKVAMYMDGNWWMEDFGANIEDFEWGVAVLPQRDIVKTGVYVDTWSVINGSKHPAEAWQVLDYLMQEDTLKSGIANGIPPMISVAETAYADLYSYVDEASRAVWLEGNAYGRTPTYTTDWAEIITETDKVLNTMAIGELTPEETAAEIERKVNGILSR